jgi:hypothetical protein
MTAHEQKILLGQPIHYTLPNDLRFQCLGESRGDEVVRLRFSRGDLTVVDIPLTAETLISLAEALTAFAGTIPKNMKQKREDLHSEGLRLNP